MQSNTGSMKILVACEFSGTVRRAFTHRGHDAWSCDLLPAEDQTNKHIIGDVREILDDGWDMLIVAHPPCTRLCNSGVRWLSVPPSGKTIDQMWQELDDGCSLFSDLWNAGIDRIAIENPVMHKHAKERIRNYTAPAQTIQPWQFGHGETKRTCLWLKNLPSLEATKVVAGRNPRVHRMPPRPGSLERAVALFRRRCRRNGRSVGKHLAAKRCLEIRETINECKRRTP